MKFIALRSLQNPVTGGPTEGQTDRQTGWKAEDRRNRTLIHTPSHRSVSWQLRDRQGDRRDERGETVPLLASFPTRDLNQNFVPVLWGTDTNFLYTALCARVRACGESGRVRARARSRTS